MKSRGQHEQKTWKQIAKYFKMSLVYIKFSTNEKNVFGKIIQNLGIDDLDPDDNAQVKNEFILSCSALQKRFCTTAMLHGRNNGNILHKKEHFPVGKRIYCSCHAKPLLVSELVQAKSVQRRVQFQMKIRKISRRR